MKIAILGASRGLGAALAQALLSEEKVSALLLISRNKENLNKLKQQSVIADAQPNKVEVF